MAKVQPRAIFLVLVPRFQLLYATNHSSPSQVIFTQSDLTEFFAFSGYFVAMKLQQKDLALQFFKHFTTTNRNPSYFPFFSYY